jgi:hypothetical protein
MIDAKFARRPIRISYAAQCAMWFQRGFSLLPGPRYTRTQPRRRESATVGECEPYQKISYYLTVKWAIGTVSCPPAAAPPPVRASIARCTCVDPAPHTVGPRSAAGWHAGRTGSAAPSAKPSAARARTLRLNSLKCRGGGGCAAASSFVNC